MGNCSTVYTSPDIETKGCIGNAFRTTDFFKEPDGFECDMCTSETGQDMSYFVSGIMREHKFELHDHNNIGTLLFIRGLPPEVFAFKHFKSKRNKVLEPIYHNYSMEDVLNKSFAPNLGSLKCRVLDLLVQAQKYVMVPGQCCHPLSCSSSLPPPLHRQKEG
eukprot:scaffold167459_cov70-Attheya_sp.AAC.1